MEKMKLKRIGENVWGHMAYQDVETGKFYLDLNYGFCDAIDLHTCSPSDDMDGEPSFPLKREYEIINPVTGREKQMKQCQFEYMMLSRLISDCRGFFGRGSDEDSWDCRYHNEHFISGQNIKSLVFEAKKLWNQIPEDLNPEWVTWEEIENFEKQAESYS